MIKKPERIKRENEPRSPYTDGQSCFFIVKLVRYRQNRPIGGNTVMSIEYALLVGQVSGGDREDDDPHSPHYTIYVTDNERSYRVPVNVQSVDGSQVLYYHDTDFDAPVISKLELLGTGLLNIQSGENGITLDYVRGGYVTKSDMKPLPATAEGNDNDLQDIIHKLILKTKSQREHGAKIFVFGEQFPGGMHDIHMNQGNEDPWKHDNGVWQDGGLIFYFPFEDQYHALFFAFQTQSWRTDDYTGHPISKLEPREAELHEDSQAGYQDNFLGENFIMPLPSFDDDLNQDVLRKTKLNNNYLIEHPNYSVVMSRKNRQAIFSAANADFARQGLFDGQGRDFRLDPNLDESEQLGGEYYGKPYDRGHITKRHAVAWGRTKVEADRASRDSCFFSNISLQESEFHRDEWGRIENAITQTRHDINDRFNIITGPIYTSEDESVRPASSGREPANAPSGFWKIISYISAKSGEIEVDAFISFQNERGAQSVKDAVEGRSIEAFKVYQTSTTLIERLTGLKFEDVYRDNNPMLFFDDQLHAGKAADDLNRPQLETIANGRGFIFSHSTTTS